MYPRETVMEVLAANPIEEIVGSVLTLQNAGSGRKKALCPFHQEKTPSFTINVHRQIFHCFGCGKGGDAIKFVMEHEGLAFTEALRKLADRAGIRLPAMKASDGRAEYVRTQMLQLGGFAQSLYRRFLDHPERGRIAREYLAKRKLGEKLVERFGVGFAPDEWGALTDAAKQKNYPLDVMEGSGLCKRKEGGGLYDAFRNRLMFPIKDLAGNVVAFGGRDLGGESPAKYINSPETAIYKKSRVLYGLYEARDALRKANFAILVEGYIDLLRCFEAGVENVVATCGTALTPEQAGLIRRYVPEVVVVYDGDAAGIKAALRGTGVLTAAGLAVRAMTLPGGQDPDDFIRDQGGDAFRNLLSGAQDFITFYAQHSKERLGTVEGRTEVAHELFAILAGIEDEVRLDEYVKQTASALSLNAFACRREFDNMRIKAQDKRPPARMPTAASEPGPASYAWDDCQFVAALLQDAGLRKQSREALQGVTLPPGPLADVLALVLQDAAPMGGELDDAAQRLYTAAAATELAAGGDFASLASKRINRFKFEALRSEAAAVDRSILEAEQTGGGAARLAELLARKIEIKKQMERAVV